MACGSIPEPSEGRDPSCRDTGSHASSAMLVVHKAIHTALAVAFTLKNLQLFSIHMMILIVLNGCLISFSVSIIVPQALIFHTHTYIGRLLLFFLFNPTRACPDHLDCSAADGLGTLRKTYQRIIWGCRLISTSLLQHQRHLTTALNAVCASDADDSTADCLVY